MSAQESNLEDLRSKLTGTKSWLTEPRAFWASLSRASDIEWNPIQRSYTDTSFHEGTEQLRKEWYEQVIKEGV